MEKMIRNIKPTKKNAGERQNPIDHFSLRHQVHKVARDQKGLAAGNEQCNADVDGSMTERDVGRAHRNEACRRAVRKKRRGNAGCDD